MTCCNLNVFQDTVAEGGLMRERTGIHTTLQNLPPAREPQQKASEWSCSVGATVQLPTDGKKGPDAGVRHIPTSLF